MSAAGNAISFAERMRIDASGNVGIGTTSPTVKLEVAASVNGNPVTSGSTQTNGALRVRGSATNVLDIGQQSASPYAMWMQVCESTSLGVSYPLVINPNGGNVGIGTTSPGEKLEVAGSINLTSGQLKLRSDTALDHDGSSLYVKAPSVIYFYPGNSNKGNINTSGTLTVSGDLVAFSDKKLKKNIKTLDGSKVYKMRGVSFDRVDTDKPSSGVIAQEIQEIAPELVNESDGTLGVAYGNLTGYLIEAIKELKAEIEELKKSK